MSRLALTPWLFGKLPALGDFVSRGIDMATRDRLDAWLSSEMEAARERWGEAFEARYDAAPAWTFVEQDEDGNWYGGALCASMDRAGRRFPLLAAAPAENATSAAAIGAAWIDSMAQGFGEGWDADTLLATPLAAQQVPWQPTAPEWALVGEQGPAVRLLGSYPTGVIDRMLELAA
jgi:type VI secretion system ImpM family protein